MLEKLVKAEGTFMVKVISFRRVTALAHIVIGSLLVPVCLAQEPGGQEPSPGQSEGGQPGAGRPQPGSQPIGRDRPQQPQFPDTTPRSIYLSGSVRLADGTPPPDSVMIERVCNGVVRPEAYTDSKGNFSFMVGGQQGTIFSDASVGNDPFQDFGGGGIGDQRGTSARDLTGCEIRARLAGFQSDSIMLTFRGALDDPEIGIIRLRRLANVEGFTFSITSAAAPKNAKSAFEKGIANAKKQKWPDAEKEFLKAVQSYPKYAIAWYELGRVSQQQKKFDEAGRAYNEAINIDPKFISPYGQLAVLAAIQQRWDDAVLHSSEMIRLNPQVGPDIYFYSAVANYNLQKIDAAETHAREAATLDSQHKNPKINHLLGIILAQKQKYREAADHLRTYLTASPNAADEASVKQMLAELDKAAGEPGAVN